MYRFNSPRENVPRIEHAFYLFRAMYNKTNIFNVINIDNMKKIYKRKSLIVAYIIYYVLLINRKTDRYANDFIYYP